MAPGPSDPDVISAWLQQFRGNLRGHPGAERAWRRLAAVPELGPHALWLLYQHANGALIAARAEDRIRAARPLVRSAQRAARVAAERQGSRRLVMFAKRHAGASDALERALGPFPNSRAARWHYHPQHYLGELRALAAAYGLRLGPKSLAALAACASPGAPVDEGSIRRFLRSAESGDRARLVRSIFGPT